jgi:hypothetical protein
MSVDDTNGAPTGSAVIHIVVSADEKRRIEAEAAARKMSVSKVGYVLMFGCTQGFENFEALGPKLVVEREVEA